MEPHIERPQPSETPSLPLAYVPRDPRLKSPALAALLSLMPGLGQAYLGYYQVGFLHIGVVASLITLLASDVGGLTPLLALLLAFFWLFNLVDAARRALMLNQALSRLEPVELPVGFGALSRGARLVMGLGMVAVGVLAFAHLRFGLSFAWLQRWWPLGLVAVGIYLVVRALREGRNASLEA